MGFAKKIVVALVAIPCVLAASIYIRNKAVGPEGWAMDNTENQLRARLKDPDSLVIRTAQTFSKPNAHDGGRDIYICGTFDGKNSFGAYGGANRFVSWSSSTSSTFDTISVSVEDDNDVELAKKAGMESAFERVYWKPHCREG